MHVVVIGGTGHIGSFLTPRLVETGHEVTVVCRQQLKPYFSHAAWEQVAQVSLDRKELEGRDEFGAAIANLNPDVVIDLICYQPESARQLVSALQDRLKLYLFCGTIWVHGYKVETPSEEWHTRRPIGDYGKRKAAIEHYLLNELDQERFPATALHPGHLVGPGWNPINPIGNFNPDVFKQLASGEQLLIPHLGLETLHHVHADDVAMGFVQALTHMEKAIGESFHILSEKALTWHGYAESMAEWYGQKANLRFVPWEEFRQSIPEKDVRFSWDHLLHSTSGSIEKARRLLNYNPQYSSLQAIQQSLAWSAEHP